MSAIRGKDTKPELVVRKILYAMGFRYRLHVRALPGTPDIVLSSTRKIINVHGCFWHLHRCRRGRSTPKTNEKFWDTKRRENVARDRQARSALRKIGWDVLEIWECELGDRVRLINRIEAFLKRENTRRRDT